VKAVEILTKHHLKRTGCREGIIDVIMASANALSENEIRDRLSGNYDRTTFYRSFKTLERCNILHKIVVDNHFVKYALNDLHTHGSNHAHFYCNKCQTVQCLDSIELTMPGLPKGFHGEEMNLVIKGTCNLCNPNTSEE